MTALPADSVVDAAVLQAVDRATAELRRGGFAVLRGPYGVAALVHAAEGADEQGLARLRELSRTSPLLLLTAQRAAALGISGAADRVATAGVVALELAGSGADLVSELADPTSHREASGSPALAASPVGLDVAAVDLAKLARLLPAVLLAPLTGMDDLSDWTRRHDLLSVGAHEIADYRYAAVRSLNAAGEARVPLEGAENTRIIAFRPRDGGIEHLAIIIGEPAVEEPVLTRLHSECFTGDLLGSLRCDCGDQLRGAIQAISKAGAGLPASGPRGGHLRGQRAAGLRRGRAGLSAGRRDVAASGLPQGAAADQQSGEGRGTHPLRRRGRGKRAARLSLQRPQRLLSGHQGGAFRPPFLSTRQKLPCAPANSLAGAKKIL
jgi:hypothetical protein